MTKSRRITARQADAFLKGIFSRKDVLAALLHSLVTEFDKISQRDIARKHLLPQGESRQVQLISNDFGCCRNDIVFTAMCANYKSSSDYHIFNIEFQNVIHPSYEIIKRGIYYGCGLLYAEKGTLFKNSDYDGLRKVHGIWICPRAPVRLANTISRYNLHESTLAGNVARQSVFKRDIYDMLELTFLYLNDAVPPQNNRALRLIYTLISSKIPNEEREKILKKEFSITSTTEEKEMYDLFYYAKLDGRKEGKKEGKLEGRKEGRIEGISETYQSIIKNLISLGKAPEEIQSLLALPLAKVKKIIARLPKEERIQAEESSPAGTGEDS